MHCFKKELVVLGVHLQSAERREYVEHGKVRLQSLYSLRLAVKVFVDANYFLNLLGVLHGARAKLSQYLVYRELVVYEGETQVCYRIADLTVLVYVDLASLVLVAVRCFFDICRLDLSCLALVLLHSVLVLLELKFSAAFDLNMNVLVLLVVLLDADEFHVIISDRDQRYFAGLGLRQLSLEFIVIRRVSESERYRLDGRLLTTLNEVKNGRLCLTYLFYFQLAERVQQKQRRHHIAVALHSQTYCRRSPCSNDDIVEPLEHGLTNLVKTLGRVTHNSLIFNLTGRQEYVVHGRYQDVSG